MIRPRAVSSIVRQDGFVFRSIDLRTPGRFFRSQDLKRPAQARHECTESPAILKRQRVEIRVRQIDTIVLEQIAFFFKKNDKLFYFKR